MGNSASATAPAGDLPLLILLYGNPKTGKSTTAATGPAPRLIFDTEYGTKFLDSSEGTLKWDPEATAPPDMSKADTCVVDCPSYSKFHTGLEWLRAGKAGQFKSIVVDSITDLQLALRIEIAGDKAKLGWDEWGQILSKLEYDMSQLRKYCMESGCVDVMAVTAPAKSLRDEDGNIECIIPKVKGGFADTLLYLVDAVGYIKWEYLSGSELEPVLTIGRNNKLVTGSRFAGIIPDKLALPTLTQLHKVINKTTLTEGSN